MPFFYAGLAKNVYNGIEMGLRVKWINRDGEHFTEDYDRSDDELSDEISYSLFMLVRL